MKTIALASVLAALAGTAGASEVFVTPDDDLGSLLFGAESGSVFVLGPGEYVVEAISLVAPNFALRSTDGAESTVITLASGEDLLISGSDAGVLVFEGITLRGIQSTPTRASGLVAYDTADVRIVATDCRFEGPGWGFSLAERSDVTFRNCSFDGFTDFAAVNLFGSAQAVFDGCVFRNFDGSGRSVSLSDSTNASFDQCLFEDNTTDDSGAAIFFDGGPETRGSLTVSRSVFRRNTSVQGGAIDVSSATVRILGSVFEANTVGGTANGAAILAGVGDRALSVQDSVFIDNRGNSDTLALAGAFVSFTNNVVVQRGPDAPDVAMFIGAGLGREVVVSHNTIVGPGAFGADARGTAIGGAPTLVSNNVVRGFSEPFFDDILFTAGLAIEFNNIEGFDASGTNIDADPLFADVAALDFRLSPGSPSIDAGSPDLSGRDALDRDGDLNTFEPIPVDSDGAPRRASIGGTITNPDQGAFEFAQTVATPCTPADLVEPFGVVDLSDVDAFVASFLAACP